MPQGRRKVPFSGKAKKQQMQAKKQRQSNYVLVSDNPYENLREGKKKTEIDTTNIRKRNNKIDEFEQTYDSSKKKYEISQKNEEEGRSAINMISLKEQELSSISDYFPPDIDMPKRPLWNYVMQKSEVESREEKYFHNYKRLLREDVSYYETNLEFWRQLWRVIEMSDILLVIVDIRFAPLMFPPYLYTFIKEELGKDMILILNKIDLASPALTLAWRNYFANLYPDLHILMFTSFPNNTLKNNTKDQGTKKLCKRERLKMASEKALQLLEECKTIVGDKVDLGSWNAKIQEEMHSKMDVEDIDRKNDVVIEKQDFGYIKHEKYKNGILTIGCIGTPNVGKSSLINSLIGKKVVSVSRTPGHTKHFQTIFLTKTVCLCDCPGLVFPSLIPRPLQILMGLYPIAQVRDPYRSIRFIAERIDLPKILNIKQQSYSDDGTWSAMDICDGWAAKKDYYTAKAARLDTYRAANSILRMSLEGRIRIYIYPTNWSAIKDYYENQIILNGTTRKMKKMALQECKQQTHAITSNRKYSFSDIEEDEDEGLELEEEEDDDDDYEQTDKSGGPSLKEGTSEEESKEEEEEEATKGEDELSTIGYTNNKFDLLPEDM
ncbi:PREDICTED: guanine nucleotide-binding protein-like 1 [Polistes dominula]|uniref:Guanine nucleotide-binding protein-like 1 n=1 Tax=Polistes dominula TaxID=743375 RepID=A0ABM1I5B9_POLDO|nr:PREDICTED: guanine nucleotide-binding protein-like 1 [Polistes dominula]